MKTVAAILALALALPLSANAASAAERGGGFRGGGAGFHGGFGGFRGGFGGPRVYLGFGAPLYDPFWPGYYPYAYPYPAPHPEYYPPYETAPPPAAQSWYYCDDPQGYYPYVQSCNHPWQPATPPAG